MRASKEDQEVRVQRWTAAEVAGCDQDPRPGKVGGPGPSPESFKDAWLGPVRCSASPEAVITGFAAGGDQWPGPALCPPGTVPARLAPAGRPLHAVDTTKCPGDKRPSGQGTWRSEGTTAASPSVPGPSLLTASSWPTPPPPQLLQTPSPPHAPLYPLFPLVHWLSLTHKSSSHPTAHTPPMSSWTVCLSAYLQCLTGCTAHPMFL